MGSNDEKFFLCDITTLMCCPKGWMESTEAGTSQSQPNQLFFKYQSFIYTRDAISSGLSPDTKGVERMHRPDCLQCRFP
ncbi:MAG TPA: hypothetical protein VMR98_05715, partial [Candidatus Polarisedimenticolaceae bacterium]|nr:hypothetical protein [Candidatus Polarisedimenticolaceae bacterium]